MIDIERKIIAYHEEANDYRLCLTREEIEEIKNAWNDGYECGGRDMEKAKQIVIDMLLEQIKNITDSLPTCDRYEDYGCPNSVDDCFDCMMESFDKIKENLGLKEQNNG